MLFRSWVLVGYSIAFGGDGLLWGGFAKVGLAGITPDTLSGTIPEFVFCMFQLMFAIITPALIAGAIAERLAGRRLVLLVEPGRAIAADAGILLARVEYLKLGGERNFAVVDAALRHLPGIRRHVQTPPDPDQAGAVQQHDADTRAIGQARVFRRHLEIGRAHV